MNTTIRTVVRIGLSRIMSTVGFKSDFNGLLMRKSDNQENFYYSSSYTDEKATVNFILLQNFIY